MNVLFECLAQLCMNICGEGLTYAHKNHNRKTGKNQSFLSWFLRRLGLALLVAYGLYLFYAGYLQYLPQALRNLYVF